MVGTGRNETALRQLQADGHIVNFVVADVTQPGQCQAVVTAAAKLMGGLTTLVNAAGVLYGGAMGNVDMDNYHKNMVCNTQAPFELVMHAIPFLKQQPQQQQQPSSSQQQHETVTPSIVNVSSVNGKQSFAGCVSYCMSKAALDQFTRCASVDLAPFGIRVNAVNPGVIETNLQKVCIRVRATQVFVNTACFHCAMQYHESQCFSTI